MSELILNCDQCGKGFREEEQQILLLPKRKVCKPCIAETLRELADAMA